MAVPGPYPEFGAPEGLVRGADRDGPIFPRTPWPSIGATYIATLGIAAALRARQVSGEGQRVTTSLLQGALAAACLNWQRVEDPDAPLYWMWPVDSRSIEGLYECADGKWVHHWTVRPRWVLAAAEGDSSQPSGSTRPTGTIPIVCRWSPMDYWPASSCTPNWRRRSRSSLPRSGSRRRRRRDLASPPSGPPSEALADKSFLADGCVVEVDDPEEGPIHHAGPLAGVLGNTGLGSRTGAASRPAHREVLAGSNRACDAPVPPRSPAEPLAHPLAGIRVLDLGLGVAGPFTGRALADLGADVIKINALHDTYWNGTHMGLGTNRGQAQHRAQPQGSGGREVLEKLLEHSDVITLNWRPGAAARLGLDYETLRDALPQVGLLQYSGVREGSPVRSAGHRPERRRHDGDRMGGRGVRCW